MTSGRELGWLLLALWATWLTALSGHWTQFAWLGRFTPELHTALFVALAARVPPGDIAKLAVCIGLGRVAVSIDPPAAVLAGALFSGALLRVARGTVQIESPVIAAGMAFLLCVAGSWWLELVQLETRAAAARPFVELVLGWRTGISTGVVTAAFAAVLARLPGLGSLVRRKAWAVGASSR